jgi:hypothetical protein
MEVKNLPILKQAEADLEVALKDRADGETFSFDQLDKMAGLDVRKYRSVIATVQNRLLKQGKLLQSLRGKGYQLCKQNEYVRVASGFRTKSIKALKRGGRVLQVINLSQLTDQERNEATKEAGIQQFLVTADRISRSKKVSKVVNYDRPPSEMEFIKFLMDKSEQTKGASK